MFRTDFSNRTLSNWTSNWCKPHNKLRLAIPKHFSTIFTKKKFVSNEFFVFESFTSGDMSSLSIAALNNKWILSHKSVFPKSWHLKRLNLENIFDEKFQWFSIFFTDEMRRVFSSSTTTDKDRLHQLRPFLRKCPLLHWNWPKFYR